MPIYLKPGEQICSERARNDAKFYYDQFREILLELIRTNDPSARQDLARLDRWIMEYEIFAKKYHLKNFVFWSDCFVNEEDAKIHLGTSAPRPRAPFIPAFDDLY